MKQLLPKKIIFVACLVWAVTQSSLAQSCYNSIGYMPSWQGDVAAIDYSKWTHINYAFGIPNSNGTVNAIENSAKLVDLVNRGHASNTKVLLAIGGWMSSSPSATPFDAMATNGSVNAFVNTCANLITQYNLDGIDIDWEYPTSQANWNALMGPLASRIHSMGKLLTSAVACGAYFGNAFGDMSQLDYINIMAYDCNCPTNSPYSAAVDGVNYWAGRGIPQNKRMLGLPFYSSDNNTSLHVQKTNFAKTNAGGIMVWEISSPGDINSIVSTLGTLCKGSTQSGVATFYKDCNYGGTAVSLAAGDYTLSQLNAKGILNDDVSSVKVNSGYKVTLYWDDNFGGTTKVLTSDMACDGTWNDKTSSVKIATNSGSFSTTIQAENWISMAGVQTETTTDAGGGLNVGWIDAGDWMAYNVTIPSAGTYRVIYRVASPNSNETLRLEKDAGATQLGSVTIPNTGGWQNWTNVAHNVTLPAGTYSIGIATASGGFNLNYLTVTSNLSARMADGEVVLEGDDSEIVLSPNPVEDHLFIAGKVKQVKVYDIRGQEMMLVDNPGSSISVETLKQGLHVALIIKENGKIERQKFIKK